MGAEAFVPGHSVLGLQKYPAGHDLHDPMPSLSWYVPMGHLLGEGDPAGQ